MISRSHSRQVHEKVDPAYRDRRIWENSFELALAIFKIAEKIPEDIGAGLSAQIRIVALSVISYVARGQSGATSRELLRGLYQARCALSELEARMSFCAELGYATDLEIRRINVQIRDMARMIDPIIGSLRGILEVGERKRLSARVPDSRPRSLYSEAVQLDEADSAH